ncbi:MAG: hypothetical protein E7532_01595 [Ruminococcaceae bacterium]|nr:hypothetical protein [Oscillospiraceae bacterium]
MKKTFLIVIFILMLFMLGACNQPDEPSIEGSWYTTGTVIGLDYNTIDVYLNFMDNSQGNITNKHPDNKEDVFIFEYTVDGNNLIITSSEGEKLDADLHVYPFKIEGNTLKIEAFNQTHEYTRSEQGGN